MSLSEILDEINGGVEDIPKDDPLFSDVKQSQVATEEVRSVKTNENGFRINLGNLDKSTLVKFNDLYRRCVIKQTTSGMSKVDRSIVMEAMASLPSVNPTYEAKLTRTASSINRKILDDIIYKGDDKVPEAVKDLVQGLLEFTEVGVEKITKLTEIWGDLTAAMEAAVECKNLKTTEVYVTELVQNSAAFELAQAVGFIQQDKLSYEQILQALVSVKLSLEAGRKTIETFNTVAKGWLDSGNETMGDEAAEVVSYVEPTYDVIELYNKYAPLIEGQPSVLEEFRVYLDKL